MTRIFISYRREDSEYFTDHLDRLLSDHYGRDNVFRDVDSIPLGEDFKESLARAVQSCAVLLAIIGKGWLQATDRDGRRRLENPRDFVRIEIEAALARDIPVIPVVLQGASVPTEEQLPPSLRSLTYRNGLEIGSGPRFKPDVGRLIGSMNRILERRKDPSPKPPPEPTPRTGTKSFKYRYVGPRTTFCPASGLRTSGKGDPDRLHDNEIAVDVGGACWGHAGEERSILDHHFLRPGQYPSAAAAVLHNAHRLQQRFGSFTGALWLVTHQQPDFDAFCAMYLVKQILLGTTPAEGWRDHGLEPDGWSGADTEIRWFEPDLEELPAERRWPVLLAAYAAYVDNCRRVYGPKHRTLASVLTAAIARGRHYRNENNGAGEFFDEVRQVLQDEQKGLNPLYDSVLDGSTLFKDELELLDRQVEAYQRDIDKAARTVVHLQRASTPFPDWFRRVQATPLLNDDQSIEPLHLRPAGAASIRADGIFLRDPECLFFKDWVRNDTIASLGRGFSFSGVAYSRGRTSGQLNESDYYFSLDMDQPIGWHLYDVWATLQAREVQALIEAGLPSERAATCRSGFEARSGSYSPYFDDPWFDGSSYRCTIIGTPARGTFIGGAGMERDLSDDPVAQLVRTVLERKS